jgi:hypothetical protein
MIQMIKKISKSFIFYSFDSVIGILRKTSSLFQKLKDIFVLARKTSPVPYLRVSLAFAGVVAIGEGLSVWRYHDLYQARVQEEQGHLESSLRDLFLRLEAHGKFVALMMKSDHDQNNVFKLIYKSPVFLKDLVYKVSLEDVQIEKPLASSLTASQLVITTPLSDQKTYLVMRVSLTALHKALDLEKITYSQCKRSFTTKIGPFSYPSKVGPFWSSLLKEQGSQMMALFLECSSFLLLYILSHLGTLIYDRSFKREEIKELKKELAGARHELLRLESQLVALEEEKASQEEKQRLVRNLRKFVVACRKRQLGKLDTCVTLLKGVVTGQYDMEAEEIGSTLETLSKLVTQLEGGEVTAHGFDTVAMEILMSRVTTLLSYDFKRNESQMILDPSLSGMTLNSDEKAMEFFLYAFFKEILDHLFTGTVLILSKHSQKENTLCVSIQGTYMREHLSFLGDTIDLGFTRLSKKGLERMARRLGVQCQTLLEGCELTFSRNSSQDHTLKKKEVFHNVIALFA